MPAKHTIYEHGAGSSKPAITGVALTGIAPIGNGAAYQGTRVLHSLRRTARTSRFCRVMPLRPCWKNEMSSLVSSPGSPIHPESVHKDEGLGSSASCPEHTCSRYYRSLHRVTNSPITIQSDAIGHVPHCRPSIQSFQFPGNLYCLDTDVQWFSVDDALLVKPLDAVEIITPINLLDASLPIQHNGEAGGAYFLS